MSDELANLESKSKKTIEAFKKELSRMRTGRASSAMLEGIQVDYYGTRTPLIQLGMINVPEPRQITIQVYDGGAVEAVEKAIHEANLGLNPSREGTLVRLNIPPLTEERRKEFIKKLHKEAEDVRVAIRNHRRDSNEVIKTKEKDKAISQDESRKLMERIQASTDKFIKEVDSMLAQKEKEMMIV